MTIDSKTKIYFLPWANLLKKITIGNISFIPFSQRRRGIFSKSHLLFLKKFFLRYKNIKGKSITEFTLCTSGDNYSFNRSV